MSQVHRGEKKEITTQEKRRKARREGAFLFVQDYKTRLSTILLCPPPPLSAVSQHHTTTWRHTTVTPQLHLIFPTHLHKSLASKEKENSQIWLLRLQFICDLAIFTGWIPPSPPPPLFLLRWVIRCAWPSWDETHSNKHFPPGSYGRNTTLRFLEKYSHLIAALKLLYVLALTLIPLPLALICWTRVQFLHLQQLQTQSILI